MRHPARGERAREPCFQPYRLHLNAAHVSRSVVAEALEWGADLVVCHHPLLLTPVHGVAAVTPKGRVVHDLMRAGVNGSRGWYYPTPCGHETRAADRARDCGRPTQTHAPQPCARATRGHGWTRRDLLYCAAFR